MSQATQPDFIFTRWSIIELVNDLGKAEKRLFGKNIIKQKFELSSAIKEEEIDYCLSIDGARYFKSGDSMPVYDEITKLHLKVLIGALNYQAYQIEKVIGE